MKDDDDRDREAQTTVSAEAAGRMNGVGWRLSDAVDEGLRNFVSRPSRTVLTVVLAAVIVGAGLFSDRTEVARIEAEEQNFRDDGGYVAQVSGEEAAIDPAACLRLSSVDGVLAVAVVERSEVQMVNETSGLVVPINRSTEGIGKIAWLDPSWLEPRSLASSQESAENNDWYPGKEVVLAERRTLGGKSSGGSDGNLAGDGSPADGKVLIGDDQIFTVRSLGDFSRIGDAESSGLLLSYLPEGPAPSCIGEAEPWFRPWFLDTLATAAHPEVPDVRAAYRLPGDGDWARRFSSRATKNLPLMLGIIVGAVLATSLAARRTEYGLYRATGLSRITISVIRVTELVATITTAGVCATVAIAATSPADAGWTIVGGVAGFGAATLSATLVASVVHPRASVWDLVRDR